MKSYYNTILQCRKTDVLITLLYADKYVTEISKNTNTEFSYTYKLLKMFESVELVKSYKNKRRRYYKLTPLGKKIVVNLKKIMDELRKKYYFNLRQLNR